MNQLATPGLGSIMAGCVFIGAAQLLLAVAGFALVFVWFALILVQAYSLANMSESGPTPSYARYGEIGALLFVASWFWSLGTSLRLWRQAKEDEPPLAIGIPPRIPSPGSASPGDAESRE